jgi:hypothetical protein
MDAERIQTILKKSLFSFRGYQKFAKTNPAICYRDSNLSARSSARRLVNKKHAPCPRTAIMNVGSIIRAATDMQKMNESRCVFCLN